MKPFLGSREVEAASAVIQSGWVAQGPRVADFEGAFAARVGARYAVAVSSCTAALHLGLTATGIGRGDEVVVPSFSFIATANAVRYVGATPVFVDVDEATGNITPDTIRAGLSPSTRAVIVVHQGGMPADMEPIRALCEPRGVVVLEDAACAAGSVYAGRSVGAGAMLAAWSFHPRKILTTGEGGMLTTDDAGWAQRVRRLREHGMSVSAADRHSASQPILEQYLETGFNYRMTDIQAAIGIVQLDRLDDMVSWRRQLARRYQLALAGTPGVRAVVDPPWGESNYQSFWVMLDRAVPRDVVLARLQESSVSARRGIMAAHTEPAYAGHGHLPLPVTERLTSNTLILPLFHTMTESDQDHVLDALERALR